MARNFPSLVKVKFVIPENDSVRGRVFAAIMEEAQNLQISEEEDKENINTALQLNAHYMAAICCFIPSLVPSCELALNELGADLHEVHVPQQALDNLLLPDRIDQSKNLIIFGQLALLAYKSEQRASAIRARVWLNEDDKQEQHHHQTTKTDPPLAFDEDRARKIRAISGRSLFFRQALLRSLIDMGKKRGSLGHLCKYLCRVIAWTDMDDFVVASDIFLATKSPVLSNWKVASEVKALKEAFELINRSQFPQFFGILGSDSDLLRVSGCRFPTLVRVAERIRRERHFVFDRIEPSSSNGADRLVMQLLVLHRNYMRNAYF